MPDATGEPLIFTRAALLAIDARSLSEFGLPSLVLMENAARGAAEVARSMLERVGPGPVAIVCGGGNNGGDGYAMARHLTNAGLEVRLVATARPRPGSDAAINAAVAHAMGIPCVSSAEALAGAVLIVDALLGTGLDRPVSDEIATLITTINDHPAVVLAVDLPSGFDADTGQPMGLAIRAQATATLVGWKVGFQRDEAHAWTGTVHVIDIGVPASLVESLAGR